MMYFGLITVVLDSKPSIVEEVIKWPQFPKPKLWTTIELVSVDAIHVIIV